MQNIESVKIQLNLEIKKYQQDKTLFKDYSMSMKEVSVWLREKESK